LFLELFHGHGFGSLGAARHSPEAFAQRSLDPGAPFRYLKPFQKVGNRLARFRCFCRPQRSILSGKLVAEVNACH
jgi:hypothetical protein